VLNPSQNNKQKWRLFLGLSGSIFFFFSRGGVETTETATTTTTSDAITVKVTNSCWCSCVNRGFHQNQKQTLIRKEIVSENCFLG
jgi:hypothetical protein